MSPRKTSSGFTLMEVAVAGFLVALLSACVFHGILTVKQNSQTLAQRIAAQGLCLQRYEEMKSVAWNNITTLAFPATNVLLCSLSKDPAKGRLMAELSNEIITNTVQDEVNVALVDITCSWTFRGRPHSEVLHGMIVDEYSTYAQSGALSATININPNYQLPQMFFVRTTDGSAYSQLNIADLPGSFNATTVVVMPGGGGRQSITLDGSNKSVSNGKTVAFTASSLGDPVRVSVSTTTDTISTEDGESMDVTRYTLHLSCGNASFSYR